jgi:hypothetical protein
LNEFVAILTCYAKNARGIFISGKLGEAQLAQNFSRPLRLCGRKFKRLKDFLI